MDDLIRCTRELRAHLQDDPNRAATGVVIKRSIRISNLGAYISNVVPDMSMLWYTVGIMISLFMYDVD